VTTHASDGASRSAPEPDATAHVFLSYASPDRDRARAVVAALEAAGILVWLDRHAIAGGELWSQAIVEGIEGCVALTILCSEHSMRSHNVRQELQLAWHHRRPILPLLLEPVAYPTDRAYFLHGWQWIELRDRPPNEWLPEVLAALRRLRHAEHAPMPVKAPAMGATRPPTNVPEPATALVGRETDLTAVRNLIDRDDVRLVTLTGPGGTGKSRLALAAAAESHDAFPDGVFFVDMAPLTDSSLVLPQMAQVLGVQETAGQSLLETLELFLADKRLLLVLDNFEHVLDAAPAIGTLLTGCPHFEALITSRQRLDLEAEWLYEVPPLLVPDLAKLPTTEALAAVEAVALFVQRAQAAKPSFSLTAANARAVAEICVRLEGLPLAIELAAARVNVLSPQEILERLGRRLDLLTGNRRDAPGRHRTLRGAIAWSYDRLGEEEQALFRRLAIFAGGCTLDAAETVVDATGEPRSDVLNGIAALVEASLLRQSEGLDGRSRYGMLETLREFGLEQLAKAGEEEIARPAHGAHYLVLAEEVAPKLAGPERDRWLNQLDAEHDNLRAALAWAIRGAVATSAVRLSAALWWFWYVRGHLTEGRSWLEQALTQGGDPPQRATALEGAGVLAEAQGDLDRAEACYREALRTWQELDERGRIARSLDNLGNVESARGNLGQAETLHQEALALWRELDDPRGTATSLSNLGTVALYQGQYTEAAAYYEASLPLLRELDDDYGVDAVLNNLGLAAQWQGDYPQAAALHESSLAIRRDLGDRPRTAAALVNLALDLRYLGDLPRAAMVAEEALNLQRELGDRRGMAAALYVLGTVAASRGDHSQAMVQLAEGLVLAGQVGDQAAVAEGLEAVAVGAIALGQPERAAHLYGAADAVRNQMGAPRLLADRDKHERAEEEARCAIGEAVYASAWAAGRATSCDQAIAEAIRIAKDIGAPLEC
jgi:predicted ATPase